MNTDRLNRWLTLGANFGVLIGIVFLAIEVRQNNDELNLQSYQTWVAANVELSMAALDPPRSESFARGFGDSSNLSEETWVAFAYWNIGLMQIAQAIDYLYREGSLDRSLWESEIQRAAYMLALPGVQQWWEAGGRTQFTPQFVELIESTEITMTGFRWEEDRGFVPVNKERLTK
jgi:hypothetical protein